MIVHFATRDKAATFAKANGARPSRGLGCWQVRLQPTDFSHQLRLRLAALAAGAITDPTQPHAEWRAHV